jgi:hypothetical protein
VKAAEVDLGAGLGGERDDHKLVAAFADEHNVVARNVRVVGIGEFATRRRCPKSVATRTQKSVVGQGCGKNCLN